MKRNLIRPHYALAFLAASLVVPLTTIQSIQANPSPVLLNEQPADTTCTITLNPASSGSLKGRKFNVYSIFDVTTGTGGAINYTFTDNASTQLAIQKAIYKSRYSSVEDDTKIAEEAGKITIAEALKYISDLQEGEKAGDTTSQSGSFRGFREIMRK